MWPFKKKTVIEPKEEKVHSAEPIVFDASDEPLERAAKIMQAAGFNINVTLYNQLPWIAMALEKYQQLDRMAAAKTKRKKSQRTNH